MREYVPIFSFAVLLFIQSTGFAFWLGRLSADHGARLTKLEEMAKSEISTRDEVIRLRTIVDNLQKVMESMDRSMQGVQRQLANLANMKFNPGAAE